MTGFKAGIIPASLAFNKIPGVLVNGRFSLASSFRALKSSRINKEFSFSIANAIALASVFGYFLSLDHPRITMPWPGVH